MLPGWMVRAYIKGLIDEDVQVQPAGIDLTVDRIEVFVEEGLIGFSDRRLPKTENLTPTEGLWHLERGAYKIVFHETVRVPGDKAGLCVPRSSLLRMGASLECALWDPGYVGKGEALLAVHNLHGIVIEKHARVAQLFYISVDRPLHSQYRGSYQGRWL